MGLKVNLRRLFFLLTILYLTLLSSCDNDEDQCGCKSDKTKQLSDTYGIIFMHGNKPVLISLEKGFLSFCEGATEFNDGVILEDVSGLLRSECKNTLDTVIRYTETYSFKSSFFEIQGSLDYTKQLIDTPITWKHFKIEIIKSEDYGYPQGFGYQITNLNTGFKLSQPILPVQGFVPCKTEKDAAKVAFYEVSRMYNLKDDMPDLHEWDLQFIGVLD